MTPRWLQNHRYWVIHTSRSVQLHLWLDIIALPWCAAIPSNVCKNKTNNYE